MAGQQLPRVQVHALDVLAYTGVPEHVCDRALVDKCDGTMKNDAKSQWPKFETWEVEQCVHGDLFILNVAACLKLPQSPE